MTFVPIQTATFFRRWDNITHLDRLVRRYLQ